MRVARAEGWECPGSWPESVSVQGLGLLGQMVGRCTVLMDDPTYFLAKDIFSQLGCTVVGAKTDQYGDNHKQTRAHHTHRTLSSCGLVLSGPLAGLDMEALAAQLAELQAAGCPARLLCGAACKAVRGTGLNVAQTPFLCTTTLVAGLCRPSAERA